MLLLLLACDPPVPVVEADCEGPTWAGWGDGFFQTWCRSCHGEFDDYEAVVEQSALLRQVVLVDQRMPRGGGVFPEDLERLEQFLDCPSPGEGGSAWPGSAPEATWTSEQVTQALQIALSDPPHPYAALERVQEWMQHVEPGCPSFVGLSAFGAPWEGCTTAEGWTWSGLAEAQGRLDPEDRLPFSLLGDFDLSSPDGHTFTGGGRAEVAALPGTTWMQLTGTWRDSSATGFVQDWSGSMELEVGPEQLRLHGSSSVGGLWWSAEDLIWSAACEDPVGALSVREPEGAWHRVELECGGCGAHSVEGEVVDKLCLDLQGTDELIKAAVQP